MDEKTLKEKILENHIIFITSGLDGQEASEIIFRIMQWSNSSPECEINIYLSAQTYDFINAIAIYDVLCNIPNPISVFCIGYVGGFAPLFLAVATKGRRYALKHTLFGLNQPYGFLGSGANQQTEVEIEAKETTKQRETFEEIISTKLNIPLGKLHDDMEMDTELNAEEAKQYGLIDEVLR